jgi:hypothetical protein
MMSNAFNKEERVLFENQLEGFSDNLNATQLIAKFTPGDPMMIRTGDVIWRPVPYIGRSYDGTDASNNFNDATQMSIPATIGFAKHSTALMDATELRDALQENRLGEAAKQKLASDINVAILRMIAEQSTLVVAQSTAPTGFDDVALCDSLLNEVGIPGDSRYLALSSRAYNSMASNLASRQTMAGKPTSAYEKAYVGTVASFETYKLDYGIRLPAAAGGASLTISTLNTAGNYYTPVATSVATTGEVSNVDNRYQTVTVSSTTNVVAGDCFTIAAVNAVHHITKEDTGQLKTFRVMKVVDSTHLVISPPIISNQVASDASTRYQNCVVNTKASNSAIDFLNSVNTPSVSAFWYKDAFELLPGRYIVPTDAGAAVMRGTTEQGIELVMQKFYDINTMKTKYRWDIRFGLCCKQPEMAGLLLFSQT